MQLATGNAHCFTDVNSREERAWKTALHAWAALEMLSDGAERAARGGI